MVRLPCQMVAWCKCQTGSKCLKCQPKTGNLDCHVEVVENDAAMQTRLDKEGKTREIVEETLLNGTFGEEHPAQKKDLDLPCGI
jgi:hypothetical protein